jgi:hypothetical protein
MEQVRLEQLDVFSLENTIWIAAKNIDVPSYDFSFQSFFACRRPWRRPEIVRAIGRFGVTPDYAELFDNLTGAGIELIHSPEQYLLSSELTQWYPLLSDLTPQSRWYDEPPDVGEIAQHFNWPVFIRGSRQTSRHRAALSIAQSPDEYQRIVESYRENPILHWQKFVCREFVRLRSVNADTGELIPPSFEFRTFWWHGQCVGFGPYWSAHAAYSCTKKEEAEAMTIAETAARRINLPFLVVDVAQTVEGRWIAIECNDGQESGYAGISPLGLWQRVVEVERNQRHVF